MSYMDQLEARNEALELENAKLREALENERKWSAASREAHSELKARLAERDPKAAKAPNDGGPAFPVNPHPNIHGGSDGMSLRQWYTGQAIPGAMLALGVLKQDAPLSREELESVVAEQAVRIADATLRALEGGAK